MNRSDPLGDGNPLTVRRLHHCFGGACRREARRVAVLARLAINFRIESREETASRCDGWRVAGNGAASRFSCPSRGLFARWCEPSLASRAGCGTSFRTDAPHAGWIARCPWQSQRTLGAPTSSPAWLVESERGVNGMSDRLFRWLGFRIPPTGRRDASAPRGSNLHSRPANAAHRDGSRFSSARRGQASAAVEVLRQRSDVITTGITDHLPHGRFL